MAKYTDSKCRLCRREGVKLFLKGERCYKSVCALEKRPVAPGQHGAARKKVSEYGLQLGIAFQVADDILDVSSTPEALGKSIGKDAEENKLTAVKLFGLQGARQRLLQATRRAVQALEGLPETAFFTDLAEELCGRSF